MATRNRAEKLREARQAHLRRVSRAAERIAGRFPLELVREDCKPQACGECSGCCTAVGVEELKKPCGETCRHVLPGGGCGVYEERPASCQLYSCLWLQGMLAGEQNRPDRLGVLFDFRGEGSVNVITCWEVREGAADEPAAREIISGIANRIVVLVRYLNSDRRKALGPEPQMRGLKIFRDGDVEGLVKHG